MGDWFIATEGVKVVKDSASLWPQIITAISSAGAALGGVYLTHHFTHRRDERSAAAEQIRERLFIATELVFLLEAFAESCSDVAVDTGEDNDAPQPIREPTAAYPELNFQNVSGNWQVLPPRLMYLIRELPVLESEARKVIAFVRNSLSPDEHREYFCERWHQYARLGLRAITLAKRLRKMAGFPDTRLAGSIWSTQQVLRDVRRVERRRRFREAIEEREFFSLDGQEERTTS
ncbi:hypothetical protein G3G77_004727 [Salmonella enterica]|nr:hypothetical protein [Salmonella enterica]EEH5466499.1 hypothetical protein [Salmonella enterica]EEH7555984.1 hypothetical protein [Salmonella enterica]EEO5640135.1 hypothetical protein [Salmonella enterica]EEQ0204244.1 hypothetical protein [Salmonella enterica]